VTLGLERAEAVMGRFLFEQPVCHGREF
jgi:hypothetical protein